MDEIAQVGIGIVANSRVDPGAKAAERRMGQMAKRTGSAVEKSAKGTDRALRGATSNIARSFSKVEQAASRAFGSSSLTSGIAGRMGGVKQAASAMGESMASAAEAGEGLAGAVSVVGVAVAGSVAVFAAAAYAAFELGNGWAKTAAQIGRTADVIGVSTKTLQTFSEAAERAGVDKGAASGALGNLSQTLNDARYGRNPGAMSALSRLGVGLKMNKDGSVDVGTMLPAIATAIQRQNSSGRRTAASLLGIPLAALPAFSQGGKTLAADMKDAEQTAPFASDKDISAAQRIRKKIVRTSQLGDKAAAVAGRFTAINGEGAVDKTLQAALWMNDGGKHISDAGKVFSGAASDIGKAAHDMQAAGVFLLSGGGQNEKPYDGDTSIYGRIEHAENSRQDQVSPRGAIGVMQLMPDTARRIAAGMGIPFDEGRFRNDERYNRMLGHTYLDSLAKKYGGDDTLISAAYNAGEGNADKWIRTFGDPRKGQVSDDVFGRRIPFKETRDYVHRVVVEFKNAPKGTAATVHSASGAISHTMP